MRTEYRGRAGSVSDMKAWPEGAILPGTRVRVVRDTSWDGPWKREFTGVVGYITPTLVDHPWATEGELDYFVVFDEPQMDCEGCGPYSKAMIWARYVRVDMRSGWVAPAAAPRPGPADRRVFELALVEPDLMVGLEPDALYRVSLPGGMEADVYTDETGRAWYFETVPGMTQVPNPVLSVAGAGATYVVHPPAEGQFAVVLRTDERARMVEIAADPVGLHGTGGASADEAVGRRAGPGQSRKAARIAWSGGCRGP